MEKLTENLDLLLDWSIKFVPRLLMAILILIIGFWVVRKLLVGIDKAIEKSNVGPEISGFLNSMIEIVMKFAVIMAAASSIGFQVSSLLGVLGLVLTISMVLLFRESPCFSIFTMVSSVCVFVVVLGIVGREGVGILVTPSAQ